jgi:hypothetical protein
MYKRGLPELKSKMAMKTMIATTMRIRTVEMK